MASSYKFAYTTPNEKQAMEADRDWILLSGNLVLDRWLQRSFQVDQDLIPIQLSAGQNTLLIKTQNLKDDWSFLLRIRR